MFFAANYVMVKCMAQDLNSKEYGTGPLFSVQVSAWYIVFTSIRS